MKKYFLVNSSRYVPGTDYELYRPASLNNPKDNAVMFIAPSFMKYSKQLYKCKNCLVFWAEGFSVPDELKKIHAICVVENPYKELGRFYRDNNITYYPEIDEYECVGGAYIAKSAVIGNNCTIFPGAYIGGEVIMGDNVYIGAGTKIIGDVRIGNGVVIRENTIIGADGFTIERDEEGRALTITQFGGVTIEDDVSIGGMVVIQRGAIDNTIIRKRAKIDYGSFISHNVVVGEDAFVITGAILLGSSSVGDKGYVSSNATVRDGNRVGDSAVVGMGAVVVKDVENNDIVLGNPARSIKKGK